MPRWAKWLFMGIGVVATALSLWLYVHGWLRAAAAEEWPAAQGRVVATRIDESSSTDDDGDTYWNYDPVVTFDYVVAGRRYRSERLYLNDRPLYDAAADARDELAEYPIASAIEVYYNPADPGDAAAIIEGPTPLIFILTAFGLIFFAAGWFIPADRARPSRLKARFRRH